jgi:hypothetical protein
MDRIEHVRGKILHDEQVILDHVDGYLKCHEKQGRKSFYGYFEMSSEESKLLCNSTCYRLVLADGRKGKIYAEVVPSNVQGKAVAEFHLTGGFDKR